MKLLCTFAASALFATSLAFAQQAAPEIGTSEKAVTFTSGVNLVPVKVVVRDKQGKAVGDLKQSDFILTDKGKEQTISRYSLERTEPIAVETTAERVDAEGKPVFQPRANRPVAIPERFIAYIFDDIHTEIGDLIRAREAAAKQIVEVMDPSTRVAIYVASGQSPLDFTDDREAVIAKIRGLRRMSADLAENDCPPLTYYWANLVLNANDQEAFAALVENIIVCMAVMPDVATVMTRSLSIAKLAEGQRSSRMGLGIVADVARRMEAMPGTRSIVYVSSGFILDPQLRFDQQRVFDAAIKGKVVVNTLDARGLYTSMPPMGLSGASPLLVRFNQRMQKDMASVATNVLGEFANATGGTFVWNTNAYEEGFRRVAGFPEFTHVLGFSPTGLKNDGSFHELKIKLRKRPGLNPDDYEIFARSGYTAPNAAASEEEAVREELRDAVFAREEVVGLPVELSLQYFKSAPLEAHLTVVAKINLDGVRFLKKEDRHTDTLTVVSVAFDRNGNFVKGIQRVLDMRLRDETLEKLLDQGGISVRSNLDLPPGSYLVRLVVRDSEGKAMAMRNGSVEIPF
ncbi:MAG: VWA domain-containing protein [Bryobacteraceae bacterium]